MKTSNHQRRLAAGEPTAQRKREEDWTVVRKIPASAEERREFEEHLAALELANQTKDAWLITQSQKLRPPLSSMASMLGLMELAHQLALVRPLHQTPSEFNEAAFRHLRRNFEQLLGFFNELADLTGEKRFKVGAEERSLVKNSAPLSSVLEHTRV